jgi:hypothetical protein
METGRGKTLHIGPLKSRINLSPHSSLMVVNPADEAPAAEIFCNGKDDIDGGAPKALTDWKADLIYRFDWFSDGRLLCERGTTMTDVVLIRDAGGE